jgi:SAM-dependent methyltransferase
LPSALGQAGAEIVARTILRYRHAGQFGHRYVAGKLHHDPATAALLALAAAEDFGDVVDLGCGRGQFGTLLLESAHARSVIGLDCKAEHLAQARAATQGLEFETRLQDFSICRDVPAADTILLIDVLYQLDTPAQIQLLKNAAHAARRTLIIRTADPATGARSLLTQALETMFRAVWPHAGAQVNARPVQEIAAELRTLGFTPTVEPCWAGTPFSNVLLVGRRDCATAKAG